MLSLWHFSIEAFRHGSIQAFQHSSTLAFQHVGTPTKDNWFSFVVLTNINAFLRLLLWRKDYRIKGFWHYGICNASSSSIESVVLDPVSSTEAVVRVQPYSKMVMVLVISWGL